METLIILMWLIILCCVYLCLHLCLPKKKNKDNNKNEIINTNRPKEQKKAIFPYSKKPLLSQYEKYFYKSLSTIAEKNNCILLFVTKI